MLPSLNYPHTKLISHPWINLLTLAHWSHSQSHINNGFFKLVEALLHFPSCFFHTV